MSLLLSRSLPLLLTPDEWRWLPLAHRQLFWLGEDKTRTRWLVKCRGGFRSVRERAFSLIAQELGISCQSSTYLKLPADSPPFLRGDATDTHQLAILFMDEHSVLEDCENCPLNELKEHWKDKPYDVDILNDSRVGNAIDIARGELLGMLCEMFEPPGRLFTRDHIFVQIDNELMFSKRAGANLWDSPWIEGEHGAKPSGLTLAIRLCEEVLSLPNDIFEKALELPPNYRPKMTWSLRKEIDAIRPRARRFLREAGALSKIG
jgi:hypothetical protein